MKGMDRGKLMEAEINSGGEVSPVGKSMERKMARKGWERRTDER